MPQLGQTQFPPGPEQALCVQTGAGPFVMTGCAHPGIAAMVEAAKNVFGGPVHAAIGGFHLKSAWATEINGTIARLRELGVERVGPCHCSGQETRDRMADAFAEGYLSVAVGTRIPAEPPPRSPEGRPG